MLGAHGVRGRSVPADPGVPADGAAARLLLGELGAADAGGRVLPGLPAPSALAAHARAHPVGADAGLPHGAHGLPHGLPPQPLRRSQQGQVPAGSHPHLLGRRQAGAPGGDLQVPAHSGLLTRGLWCVVVYFVADKPSQGGRTHILKIPSVCGHRAGALPRPGSWRRRAGGAAGQTRRALNVGDALAGVLEGSLQAPRRSSAVFVPGQAEARRRALRSWLRQGL